MEWYEVELNGRRTVSFPTRAPLPSAVSDAGNNCVAPNKFGGVIKRGEWAWLASGCVLEVVALRTGQMVSTYEFTDSSGYDNCCIRCVEEVMVGDMESMLLAVCLESFRAAGGGCSFVALYSLADSKVLTCMELQLHVTGARFVSANCCRRSLLQNFDGCLALGSEEGVVILLDMNLNKELDVRRESTPTNTPSGCQITDYNLPLADIHRNFRQCRRDGVHFGLQIEVIDNPCAIQCLLPIDLILGLAIGLEDGRLAFYDLAELQIFYIAMPQPQQASASLVKMNYLEPLDDPRACLYVCAVHESEQHLSATIHALMYEKRLVDEDSFCYFEAFQTATVRLQLPLEAGKSSLIACQSITKVATVSRRPDDDANCLCALFWYSTLEEKNKLLIFDLNQWYKEEMPDTINCRKHPSYLAGYILNGRQCGLDAHLNPSTIAHFNSLQRFEEHFYPNSLSFDCVLLVQRSCRSYTWMGAQNKLVNILRSSSASIFLEPEACFREILRTRLMPQFSELNVNSTFSQNAKYETILSVALEHNCFSLLRDCARCWADGSFMGGNFTNSTGISLSTLTEWIWKRATHIKTRCNDLCKGLFDYAGYPLDQREQKELGYITRQLKLLADLLRELLTSCKRNIPDKVFGSLEAQFKSLRMASEYQDIILWLLNIGLLPETGSCYSHCYGAYKASGSNSAVSILYPHAELKKMYTLKRAFFSKIGENFISKKTGSCRLLFIDAFIEHECKGDSLREFWLENGGNGLYPPTSIESMLRVMLVPDVSFESKCAILLYFFLDLHTAIDEQAHKELVASFIKFPSVFKLTASLIKTVQAFWNLDRGHFLPAVDEFISPFHNSQNYPQWMLELLIESLLAQNASNLALRILEARPNLISPILKLKTLLSNELISEAFHFARSKHDETLLELFFTCCLCAGKYGVIRDLALSEKEGQLVQRILRRSKTHGAENLHFVYLLQKSKYIEAVSYLDELSRAKSVRSHYTDGNVSTDTPSLVLSAFNTTMAPVTQGLTDVYFRIRNKIKKKETDNKSPVPLSCQLIKQNANNLLGGIYHSSALSAHFATYYWGEMDVKKRDDSSLLSSNNAPFLRKPQIETHYMDFAEQNSVSYPQPYKVTEKRPLTETELHENDDPVLERSQSLLPQNPKKRRRLLGKEIVNDLSHFADMNKNASRLNASGFNLALTTASVPKITEVDSAEQTHTAGGLSTPKRSTAERRSAEFLTQPLATPRRYLNLDADASSYTNHTKSVAPGELHGILKTHTPERAERGYSVRRDVPSDENKNLRFMLPTEGADKRESIEEEADDEEEAEKKRGTIDASAVKYRSTTTTLDTTTTTSAITEEVNNDDEGAFEVILEIKPADSEQESNERRKQTVRSVSVDSNDSEGSLENSDLAEDFYSPLSSQHNSMVVDSPRSPMVLNTVEPDSADATRRKYGFISGPQPRKPLMRLSEERNEKPLTSESQPHAAAQAEITVNAGAQKPQYDEQRHHTFDSKTPTSSGFMENRNTGISAVSAGAKPSFQITSVQSLASRLSAFTPKCSSSKVGESQTNFAGEKQHSHAVKLSECSTVVGSFTSIDEVAESKDTHTETTNTNLLSTVDRDESQMLDTTLGMSSYDLTTLDTAAPTSAELMPSQNLSETTKPENRQEEVADEVIDLYENMQYEENVAELGDSDLFGEALGLQSTAATSCDHTSNAKLEFGERSEAENNVKFATEQSEMNDNAENEDVVIVLSSSSSSRSVDTESDGLEEKDVESDSEYGPEAEEEAGSIGGVEEDDYEEQDDEEQDDEAYEGEQQEEAYENEVDVDVDDYDNERVISASEYEVSNPNSADTMESVHEPHSSNSNLAVNVEDEEAVRVENYASSDDDSDNENPNSINSDEIEVTASKSEANIVNVEDEEAVRVENFASSDDDSDNENPNSINSDEIEVTARKSEANIGGLVVVEEVVEELSTDSVEIVSTEKNEEHAIEEEQVPTQDVHVVKSKDQEIIIEEMEVSTYSQDGQEIANEEVKVVTEVSSELTEVTSTNKTSEMGESEKQTLKIIESVPEQLTEGQADVEISLEGKPSSLAEEKNQNWPTPGGSLVYESHEKTLSASPKNNADDLSENQPVSSTNIETAETNLRKDEFDKKIVDKEMEAENEEVISLYVEEDDMSDNEVKQKSDADEKGLSRAPVGAEGVSTTNQPCAEKSPSQDSDHTPRKRTRSFLRSSESENVVVSTPRMRRALRGSSVPPSAIELEPHEVNVLTPRRGARGISMPSQVLGECDDADVHTPRTKPRTHSSVKQPEAAEEDETSETPRTRRSVRGTSVPHEVQAPSENVLTPTRSGRGTSVPPIAVAGKVTARRRSALLDVITEDSPVLDSPSTRTRSRARLNSMESELDASVVSGEQPLAKRTRRTSLSSSVSEQAHTPKRSRRTSVAASQEESTTPPKTLRGTRRRQSTDVKLIEEEQKRAERDEDAEEPKDETASSSSLYSSSRRLTRTQLAMMEKSAALNKLATERHTDVALISPPTAKRVSKRRSSRSTATTVHDSDDIESISSHVSNVSSRRVTRSSVKDKREDMDDDLVSNASSVGSERVHKRRSREDKSSPNVTLTTIPEDEEEEEVVHKKRVRPPKKTH